jgi:beta-phosphoglucomutase-like phosphatase (HAD superfamily)
VTPAPTAARRNWWWRDGAAAGPAVVFDLDGVLSDAASRQHFLEGRRRDWDRFFEACGDDPLIEEVARLLHLLDPRLGVVLLTGRPASVQPQTAAWLHRYVLRWDLLVMRDVGDYAAAREFKRRSVGELRSAGLDLRLSFEDDRRNAEMFRQEGVPCVYIHSGYYDR